MNNLNTLFRNSSINSDFCAVFLKWNNDFVTLHIHFAASTIVCMDLKIISNRRTLCRVFTSPNNLFFIKSCFVCLSKYLFMHKHLMFQSSHSRPGLCTRASTRRGGIKLTPPCGRPVSAVHSTRAQTSRRYLNATSWTSLSPIKSTLSSRTMGQPGQQVKTKKTARWLSYRLIDYIWAAEQWCPLNK